MKQKPGKPHGRKSKDQHKAVNTRKINYVALFPMGNGWVKMHSPKQDRRAWV